MAKIVRLNDEEQAIVCAALAVYAAHKREGAEKYRLALPQGVRERMLREAQNAIALFDRIDR